MADHSHPILADLPEVDPCLARLSRPRAGGIKPPLRLMALGKRHSAGVLERPVQRDGAEDLAFVLAFELLRPIDERVGQVGILVVDGCGTPFSGAFLIADFLEENDEDGQHQKHVDDSAQGDACNEPQRPKDDEEAGEDHQHDGIFQFTERQGRDRMWIISLRFHVVFIP
jgi:hypothetical protein